MKNFNSIIEDDKHFCYIKIKICSKNEIVEQNHNPQNLDTAVFYKNFQFWTNSSKFINKNDMTFLKGEIITIEEHYMAECRLDCGNDITVLVNLPHAIEDWYSKPDNEPTIYQSIKKTLFSLRAKNLIQYNIEVAKYPGNEKNLLLILDEILQKNLPIYSKKIEDQLFDDLFDDRIFNINLAYEFAEQLIVEMVNRKLVYGYPNFKNVFLSELKNIINNDKSIAEIPISNELNRIKRIPVPLQTWSASFNNNIFKNGYGQISKMVMQDRTLKKSTKLVYAYLCSFGAGISPNRSEICTDLKIGKTTLTDSIKALIKSRYLTVEQQRDENGHFNHNVYIIKTIKE